VCRATHCVAIRQRRALQRNLLGILARSGPTQRCVGAGWEGIVSKKVNSPYRGERNGDWVKVKARLSDEFAVVGFTDPDRSRIGIGALLLAAWHDGEWVYVGWDRPPS